MYASTCVVTHKRNATAEAAGMYVSLKYEQVCDSCKLNMSPERSIVSGGGARSDAGGGFAGVGGNEKNKSREKPCMFLEHH